MKATILYSIAGIASQILLSSEKNYSQAVYYQLTEAPNEMLSNSLPTTYIINKQGEIVVDKTGAADWNSGKVRDMLDVLIKE